MDLEERLRAWIRAGKPKAEAKVDPELVEVEEPAPVPDPWRWWLNGEDVPRSRRRAVQIRGKFQL